MEEIHFDLGYTTNAFVINEANTHVHGVVDFMLLFQKNDPIAITVIIKHGLQVGRWILSRDVFVKGALYGVPAGHGDFKIESYTDPIEGIDRTFGGTPALKCIFHAVDESDNTEYTTIMVVKHSVVKQFVEQTIQMVPRAIETESYDMDDLIRRLLES